MDAHDLELRPRSVQVHGRGSEVDSGNRMTPKSKYRTLYSELLSRKAPRQHTKAGTKPSSKGAPGSRKVSGGPQRSCSTSRKLGVHQGSTIMGRLKSKAKTNSRDAWTGLLSRSETHGPDKGAERKSVCLDASCWLVATSWRDVGWVEMLACA